MKFDFKRFFMINLGILIISFGLYFFLMPSSLATGGATGLAIVLNHIIPIPMGIILGIINVFLFILAFAILGRDFGGYTLYASLSLSLIITLLETILPINQPLTDDLFINLVFGVLIIGVGMGKSLLMSDFLISLFAALVFGARLGMYALLGTIINSLIIDKMIAGFNVKINMTIISNEFDSINKYIHEEIVRGTTIYHATGGYSNQDRKIINTIVSRSEYIKIRKFIKLVDSKAFVSISYISEVEGEGFTF